MISVAPGTLARRVLELVVAHPGELDASTIAAHLLPSPRLELPPPGAGHAARSRAYATWADAELGPLTHDPHDPRRQVRKGGRRDQATAKVSRTLGRLQEHGLVETRGPPILAPWWTRTAERIGTLEAVQASMDEETVRASLGPHLTMIAEVENGPKSAADLLGKNPCGARKRTYDDLVTWGILLPPSQRWPTARGRVLVLGDVDPVESVAEASSQ